MMGKKKSAIIGLMAETPLHPGAGQVAAAIDLPVARESTGFPYIPASSMKGALRALAREAFPPETSDSDQESLKVRKLFGSIDGAGELLFGDARLLLLPIRSLTEPYRWVTCPLILERLKRDLCRLKPDTKSRLDWADLYLLESEFTDDSQAVVFDESTGPLHLEEYRFVRKEITEIEVLKGWMTALSLILPEAFMNPSDEKPLSALHRRLTIIPNEAFIWFARFGLPVRARNALTEGTKTAEGGALWYEEQLPVDSVLYMPLSERVEGAFKETGKLFADGYLQVGGDETIGQGWVKMHCLSPISGEAEASSEQCELEGAGG